MLDLTTTEIDRMAELMSKYHGIPMDLADASLVAVVESRDFRALFALDSDFFIYRLRDGSAVTVFS